MKIECARDKIEKALNLTERATGKNLTLPILSCVLLEAKGSSLLIKATNLDIGIEVSVPAKVEKEGVVAVKGGILLGFVTNTTSDKQISLELSSGNLVVKTAGGEAVLKSFSHKDFPGTPKISGAVGIVINGATLSNGIRSVFYSASISHIKPELASVVLYGEGKNLIFVSTDSFRLAEKKVAAGLNRDIPQIIIPIKNALELARVAEELANENIKLFLGKSQLAIEGKNIYFVSRVVDGSFPDYRQIIPKESKTESVVLKEDLLRALRLTTVFSDSFNQTTFSVFPGKKKMELRAKNADVGEGATTIQAAVSGEPVEISFNHRYFSDCLPSIQSDSVSISFSGASKPTLIRGVSDTSFIYIVMPMNR
jgi:DNA polymerase-3 subunit beta